MSNNYPSYKCKYSQFWPISICFSPLIYLKNNPLSDRYRWDQSLSFQYVDVFPPGATIFTVTGLKPVTTYNFSVNALNVMGESEYADNNAVLTISTKGQF